LGTAIAVGHNIPNTDKRLVAVDYNGARHIGVHSIAPFVLYPKNFLLDAEFDLPPDRIKEYEVQTRPFEQVLISEINLRREEGRTTSNPAPFRKQELASEATGQPPIRASENPDLDSDGDGLSDFQEIHKYRSDPGKLSTGGDGVSDGEW